MHRTPARTACWTARGVHHHVGAPVLGGLDGGAQLGLGVLGDVERVVRRRDPATGHQLHLRRTAHQLLAGALQDGVDAVGDADRTGQLGVSEVAEPPAGEVVDGPEVPVAAGLGDHRAAGVDPRAGDDSRVDGLLQPERRAARVADGREPAQEGVAGGGGGEDVQEADVAHGRRGERSGGEHAVPVGVDEPRDHRAAPAVDDVRAVRAGKLLVRGRDGVHPVPADEHLGGLADRAVAAVEDQDVAEQKRGFGHEVTFDRGRSPAQGPGQSCVIESMTAVTASSRMSFWPGAISTP